VVTTQCNKLTIKTGFTQLTLSFFLFLEQSLFIMHLTNSNFIGQLNGPSKYKSIPNELIICHFLVKFAELPQNDKKQEGSGKNQSSKSNVKPKYKHLREIQTELSLWLEHNAVLKE
jgi:hypothetical protein